MPRLLLAAVLWAALSCGDPAGTTTTTADTAETAPSTTTDAALLDLAKLDTGPPSSTCPGAAGCPCKAADECATGVCADDDNSATGKACAADGKNGCAVGHVAVTAVVGEGVLVCVSATAKLCNPCSADGECAAMGSPGALCITRGGDGSFCGIACGDGICPAGYACKDATGSAGGSAKQCQPIDGAGNLTTCGCSIAAAAQKLGTAHSQFLYA